MRLPTRLHFTAASSFIGLILVAVALPRDAQAQAPFSCQLYGGSEVCLSPPKIQYVVGGNYQGQNVRSFGASHDEACLGWAAATPNPNRGAYLGTGLNSGLVYCWFAFQFPNDPHIYNGTDGESREAKVCDTNYLMYSVTGQYDDYGTNRFRPGALFMQYTSGSGIPWSWTAYPNSVLVLAFTDVNYAIAMCASRNAPIPTRNFGQTCPATPNPINLGVEIKTQREIDYAHPGALSFVRTYNSGAGTTYYTGVLGKGWQHNFAARISATTNVATAWRGDGRIISFALVGSTWVSWADVNDRLTELKDAGGVRTGWRYFSATSGDTEQFDINANLISVSTARGAMLSLVYSDGTASGPNGGVVEGTTTALPLRLLLRVSNQFGATLSLGHNADSRIVRLTRPDGSQIRYTYGTAGNLVSAIYPDTDAGGQPITRTRTYLFENASFPNALTGIIEETGQRLSTYSYDSFGRAIATEHAGGVNRHSLVLNTDGTTSVTDPLGAQRTYTFNNQFGKVRVASQSQPGGSGCGPASSAITYDVNANVASRTDFTNRKTCYGNDLTRNLETARVEGLTSAATCPTDIAAFIPAAATEQRKTLTQWHPDWRLETRRAEPKRIVTSVYNGQPDPTAGNALTTCAPVDALVDGKPIAVLCKQVEQATSDETGGQGFVAPAVGVARISQWTYNRWGQMLTHNGPRTDVTDLTTYEYYPDTQANWTLGDLKQVTNALGQVSRFTRYDRNGRVLEQLDANNSKTEYTYSPRGWLTQIVLTPAGSSSSQTTVYEYDAVGQMTRATLPDGSFTRYTYDAARRLTNVEDSAGNKVEYTLDAMGNRTREDWKDAGGVLRKTLTRTIDALNRVQQVVGGVQ